MYKTFGAPSHKMNFIADDSAFAPTTNDTMWEVLIGVLDEPGYEPLKNGYANENGTSDYFTHGPPPHHVPNVQLGK